MFTVTYSIPWNIMMTMYLGAFINMVINRVLGSSFVVCPWSWSDLPFADETVVLVIGIVLCVPPNCACYLLCLVFSLFVFVFVHLFICLFVCLLITWIHHQSSCEGMGFQPAPRYSWNLGTPLGRLRMDNVHWIKEWDKNENWQISDKKGMVYFGQTIEESLHLTSTGVPCRG